MIRTAFILAAIVAMPAVADPIRGLYIAKEMGTAFSITTNGLVYFQIDGPQLGATRSRQVETEDGTRIDLFRPGADGPVRTSMVLRPEEGRRLVVSEGAAGFFLQAGTVLEPVAGLQERCLASITTKDAYSGEYFGLRSGQIQFILSPTEFTFQYGGGQDAFGNDVPLERDVIPITTTMLEPDRMLIEHPDGDMVADHLGLGISFVAEFGSRGEFMIELYPLETRSECVAQARDLAESAMQ
ncbi:hypothetical protein [Yoonia sp. SS1-5]|uniref:DUF1849 family protein n=1 Tax=Yoonia rhodophyticola TaxID=3137370 RepID=A0AAN0MBH3_9RHOB